VSDTSTLRVRVGDIPAGEYLVRIQIDGAESLLAGGGTTAAGPTPYTGPLVKVVS
jgi:hypothetical protein